MVGRIARYKGDNQWQDMADAGPPEKPKEARRKVAATLDPKTEETPPSAFPSPMQMTLGVTAGRGPAPNRSGQLLGKEKEAAAVAKKFRRKASKIGGILYDMTGLDHILSGQYLKDAGDFMTLAEPGMGTGVDGRRTPEENDRVTDIAGAFGMDALNVAIGSSPFSRPSNSVSIFIGPRAKNFDHAKSAKAYEALRKGASPEQVWQDYKIAFDSAGIPRQWVDSPEDFNLTPAAEKWKTGRAQDPRWNPESAEKTVHAPVTYENYPEMKDWRVRAAEDGGVSGAFTPPQNGYLPKIAAFTPPGETVPKSYPHGASMNTVLAHEMGGHGIDWLEGGSFGGMPESIPTVVRQAYPGVKPYDLYRRMGGETWANMGAYRNSLPADMQASISPYFDTDISFDPKSLRKYQEEYPRSMQISQQTSSGTINGPFTFKEAFDPSVHRAPSERADLKAPPPGKGGRKTYAKPISRFGMAEPAEAVPVQQGPRRLGDFPNTEAQYIVDATKQNGGNSVNVLTGTEPTDGLMMGTYRNDDPRNMVITGQMEPGDAERFFQKNKDALQSEDKFFGTWYNPDDGKTYLDVSRRFEPDEIRKATKFGERTGQISGFNRGTFDTFPVGNWREFVNGDEFAQRMSEMNVRGAEHLAQHPNKDWWNLRGTNVEKTYTPERLPQVAGSVAATAPNMDPRRNLMVASEYMRRHIKGEPIIQPEWRVGDSGGPPVFFEPGKMMPMEQSRQGNIQRGISGLPLSGPKVESERLALLGDPDAVVLDRWWARLGEDPNRGVFTNAQEGVLDPKDYPVMQEAVRAQARKEGMTPNTYSANVWTGTREQAKTGELYGQRTNPGAISGDSKSYADHYDDLVNEKAAKLGITPEEMMQRLGSGDWNLMSWLAGTAGGLTILKSMGLGEDQREPVL